MVKRLTEPMSASDLKREVESRPLWFDERKAERIPLALSLAYVLEFPTGRLSGSTTTIDIGGNGVRFLIPQMVSPQTVCHVALTLPDRSEPLSFLSQVCWCRQTPGNSKNRYEVAVGFVISTLPDDATFEHYCHFIASQLLIRNIR